MAKPNPNGYSQHQLHFLIVGAGICGLSAAIALRRFGHKVTVIEKDPTLDEGASAGCRIAPNLHKIFCEWGLEAQLQDILLKPETVAMLSYSTGQDLGSIQWDRDVLKKTRGEFGLTSYSALRVLLYRAAISRGASVHFGARVVSLNVLSRFPSVTLECGDSIYADIVVGADGVDGITRRHFVTSTFDSTGVLDKEKGIWKSSKDQNARRSVEAEEEGLNIFSVSIPKHSILNDPKLSYMVNQRDDMFIWIGHEYAAVGFPSGGSCDFTLCVYAPPCANKDLRYILRGAEPSLRKLSRLVPSPSDSRSNLTCRPLAHEHVLDRWVEGSLVVIGEAAHPLPPGSMQSCALSVEDGVVLAKLFAFQLSSGPHSTQTLFPHIPALLAAFQSIRHSRCTFIQTKEVGIIHYMTMLGASEAERNVRDQAIRARRDTLGITVVPLQVPGYIDLDSDDGQEERSGLPCDWVEVTEVFGYEPEEEAEEWWITWGRHQIGPGTWPM